MGTTAKKLKKLLDNKRAIRDAITEKTGEDAGEVMSTYAEKIMAIEGGRTKYFRTTILLDQTITDPATMITKVYDDGGISQIRLNSHRYVCKLVDGVMQAKQLQDNNGTLYLDGTTADLTGGEGDVMMKLPQFYYRATEQETDKWLIDFVYGERPSEEYKVWDGKDFIGVYEAYVSSNNVYSRSGVTPSVSITQANFKTYARNRGEGYTLVKWKHHCIMAFLFYAEYRNTDSEGLVGKGTSVIKTSGGTDLLGMEDTSAFTNGNSQSINFFGLENWWGNAYEFVDNVVVNPTAKDGLWQITEDNGDVRDVLGAIINDSYMAKIVVGEYLDVIPSSAETASESTGYCDYADTDVNIGGVQLRSGASAYPFNGIAYNDAIYNSTQTDNRGSSRLAYRGEYETFSGFADANGGYAKGVYIQDTTGRLWTSSSWNNSATANGVAVIASTCKFVISLDKNKGMRIDTSGSASVLDGYLSAYASAAAAAEDFEGIKNTNKIISAFGNDTNEAAGYCANYTFPNGQKGYLGSAGEWQVVLDNKTAIESCLTQIGGSSIIEGTYLWASSRVPNGGTNGTIAYFALANFSGNKLDIGNSTATYYCRPFTSLNFK